MGPSTDSAFGYDVLSQFTVRIDYPRQRLWLRRRPDAGVTYGGISSTLQRRAGLLVYHRPKGLAVGGLFPHASSARLGIRPGDVLVPVDGEKAADSGSKTLETIAAGGEITVSRQANGVWVDVPLLSGLGDSQSDASGK
jgi:S1-C subfamily serine protease